MTPATVTLHIDLDASRTTIVRVEAIATGPFDGTFADIADTFVRELFPPSVEVEVREGSTMREYRPRLLTGWRPL